MFTNTFIVNGMIKPVSLATFIIVIYFERDVENWGRTPAWWGLGIGVIFGIFGGFIGGLKQKKLISIRIARTIFFFSLWCGILLEIFLIYFAYDMFNN